MLFPFPVSIVGLYLTAVIGITVCSAMPYAFSKSVWNHPVFMFVDVAYDVSSIFTCFFLMGHMGLFVQ